MIAMAGDEIRVVALSAGLQGGYGFAALEDIDPIFIQHRKSGMERGWLFGLRSRFVEPKHSGQPAPG